MHKDLKKKYYREIVLPEKIFNNKIKTTTNKKVMDINF